jgi:hypothetical protein
VSQPGCTAMTSIAIEIWTTAITSASAAASATSSIITTAVVTSSAASSSRAYDVLDPCNVTSLSPDAPANSRNLCKGLLELLAGSSPSSDIDGKPNEEISYNSSKEDTGPDTEQKISNDAIQPISCISPISLTILESTASGESLHHTLSILEDYLGKKPSIKSRYG